jgi:ElaB/YqjD/DUF883 family membrane-anchored ribosome-binding protein
VSNPAHSAEKLQEAMDLLNETAREKREELLKLIDEKYTDLKSALVDAAQASAGLVSKEGELVAGTAKDAVTTADQSVHKHPWCYIGGAAAVGLIIGLLLKGHCPREAS